jgi:hypothetical protein
MKRFSKIVGVAAASLTFILGFSGEAIAADHTMHTGDVWGNIYGWSGTGWFNEYGDVVTICDKDADGTAVAMYVYYGAPTGNPLYSFHVGGKGRCATKKAALGGSYNLPENRKIGFKFCLYKKGQSSECKDYTFVNDH